MKKIMTMATIAMMLAICWCGFVEIDAGTGDSENEAYLINIRNGDSFIYQPYVNLDGSTISVDSDCSAYQYTTSDGEEYPTFTTTFQNVQSGTSKTLHLKAVWTNGAKAPYERTQTASQYIKFTVYSHAEILVNESVSYTTATSSKTISAVIGNPVASFTGLTVGTGSSPGTSTITTTTFTNSVGTANQSLFSWVSNGNGGYYVTQNAVATADDKGTYTSTVTLTSAISGLDNEILTMNVNIIVDDNMVIIAEDHYDTYVGSTTGNSYTASIESNENIDPSTVSFTYSYDGADAGFFSVSNNTISWDPSKAVLPTDTASSPSSSGTNYKDNAFIVRASGTYSDDNSTFPVTANKTVHIRTYSKLAFMSEPEISNAKAKALDSDPLTFRVTATFNNASTVKFIWGDGDTTTRMSDGSTQVFTESHRYTKVGSYNVSVVASNSYGNNTFHTLFSVPADQYVYVIDVDDKTETPTSAKITSGYLKEDAFNVPSGKSLAGVYKDKGMMNKYDFSKTVEENELTDNTVYVQFESAGLIAEHGVGFIISGIILAISVFAFLYFGLTDIRMYLFMIGMGVLTIVLFMTNDLSTLF